MCGACMYGKDTSHLRNEVMSVAIITMLHIPLIFFFPFAFFAIILSGISYLIQHRAAHSDVRMGREYYPWHYDHHMSPQRNRNFGVRMPLFDVLLGTRLIYRGTKREKVEYGKKLLRHKRFRELLQKYQGLRVTERTGNKR